MCERIHERIDAIPLYIDAIENIKKKEKERCIEQERLSHMCERIHVYIDAIPLYIDARIQGIASMTHI